MFKYYYDHLTNIALLCLNITMKAQINIAYQWLSITVIT